jgi:hypothetical protein
MRWCGKRLFTRVCRNSTRVRNRAVRRLPGRLFLFVVGGVIFAGFLGVDVVIWWCSCGGLCGEGGQEDGAFRGVFG